MKNIPWILILILVGIIMFQRECISPETITISTPEYITEIEYIYDSIPYEVKVEKPVYVKGDTDTIYKYEDIDTAAILKDYYTQKIYNDTLIDNESAFFVLYEEVFKNQIENRQFTFINRRPVGIDIKPFELKTKFFIGGTLSGSPTQFGAGATLGLLTKQDNLYTIQYDIVNRTVGVSVYWKFYER